MLSNIEAILSNPREMLIIFLLAFPGRILALSAHEFAHAWVAYRCGDPTAASLGRMTLNPLKHLDPLGTILMLVVGFGWAKPVPVNPRNYRHYREDDLKVSLAGVTMNAILFVISMLVMIALTAFALSRVPDGQLTGAKCFRMEYMGEASIIWVEGQSSYYTSIATLLSNLPYVGSDALITPVFGAIPGYLFQMLGYFCVTNLVLCLFNLIPMPPLDGYHVLNDLVLGRSLFADPRVARMATSIMFVLVISGIIGRVLSWADTRVLEAFGRLAQQLLHAIGIL